MLEKKGGTISYMPYCDVMTNAKNVKLGIMSIFRF